jgi:hypothetical protein
MRFLLAIVALFCCFLVAAGSIAELMGAPSDPPPMIFAIDKILAAACFVCSFVAFRRPKAATIAIWFLIGVYAILCWKLASLDQLLRGIAKFAVAAAVFLTAIVVTEKYTPLPE